MGWAIQVNYNWIAFLFINAIVKEVLMMKRATITLSRTIVMLIIFILFPLLSQAQQVERPCFTCNEGINPIEVTYGDHACECRIDDDFDQDRFTFYGEMGDKVRFLCLKINQVM